MTSSRVRLALALSGAVALAFSPVVAQANTPSTTFTLQDDAEQTSEPGDEAEQTSEPGDEAEQTSEPADSEPADSEPADSEPADSEAVAEEGEGAEEGEPETSEGLEVGEELSGPVDDPGFWEEELDFLGFVNARCSVGQPDGDNPGLFTMTDAAPEGTDWILAIVLADLGDGGGVFDFFFEPLQGESFGLEGDDGGLLDLSQVILCSADLEASPDLTVDDIAGSIDINVVDRVKGPVVETDVPAPAPDGSMGGLALLGVGAVAAGAAGVLGQRKAAARR